MSSDTALVAPHVASPSSTRIGWVGTGVMGASMCGHLLQQGYPVTVTTRTRERAEQLLADGATWADTPAAVAAASDVVFSMVGYPDDVREVLLGALLPCFWIYAEVGRDIHARAAPANPYQAWIDTYAGEEFHAAVRTVIAATDEAAEVASSSLRERMHAAFARATQLEWVFWDSAFRLEAWPV